MIKELGFGTHADHVPLYNDITSVLQVTGNRTHSLQVKKVALRYFFVQELVMRGRIAIHFVKAGDQLGDFGTKYCRKHTHRYLLKLVNELGN